MAQGHLGPGQLIIKHQLNASQDQATRIQSPGKSPEAMATAQRSLELAEVLVSGIGKRWWVEEGTG